MSYKQKNPNVTVFSERTKAIVKAIIEDADSRTSLKGMDRDEKIIHINESATNVILCLNSVLQNIREGIYDKGRKQPVSENKTIPCSSNRTL